MSGGKPQRLFLVQTHAVKYGLKTHIRIAPGGTRTRVPEAEGEEKTPHQPGGLEASSVYNTSFQTTVGCIIHDVP